MKLFDFFKSKKSAPTANLAKERLQLVIAHQKSTVSTAISADQLAQMQKEVLAVVAKYVNIKDEDLSLKTVQEDGMSVIELTVCFDGQAEDKPVVSAVVAAQPTTVVSVAKESDSASAPSGLALG